MLGIYRTPSGYGPVDKWIYANFKIFGTDSVIVNVGHHQKLDRGFTKRNRAQQSKNYFCMLKLLQRKSSY